VLIIDLQKAELSKTFIISFSLLAGILLVETQLWYRAQYPRKCCFSPLAGILLVETCQPKCALGEALNLEIGKPHLKVHFSDRG